MLADGSIAFVADRLPIDVDPATLLPTLVTAYGRTTLVDRDDGSRITIDRDLVCRSIDGAAVHMPAALIVETKSTGHATPFDKALWRAGARPTPISKYCVGLAALDPSLPAHRWRRVLRHHLVAHEATLLA